MPLHMEVSMLSVLDPVLPEGSLESVGWPVPSILRLNNVEASVESESHNVVTDTGSSSVHDHRVKTIKTHHRKKVTGLDKVLIDINRLDWSFLKLDTNGFLDELNVSLLHIGWDMRSNYWNMRFVSDSTKESLHGVEQRLDVLDNVLTESECLDATIADISLSLWAVHLESQSVSAMEVEDLEVLDLCVGEQDDILAELGTRFGSGHVDVEGSV